MQHVYITLQGDDKIAIYNLDSASGNLTHQEDIAIVGGPAPFIVSPDGHHAYTGLRSVNRMVSFDIDSPSGTLTPTGSVDLESDPCYISVDATGRYLLSAYYFSGHIAVHPINPDGALGDPATEWLGTRPKAHCAHTDASNNFTFLPHVGESNAIYPFRFDSSTGPLTPTPPLCRERFAPRAFAQGCTVSGRPTACPRGVSPAAASAARRVATAHGGGQSRSSATTAYGPLPVLAPRNLAWPIRRSCAWTNWRR
ncbi:MAG: beta-propeller fold lactonase family protein, partial [Chloroflexi bacterium]|nr:beta-propeller fold lactonase family protein [Chloroflexota bacterium]